MATVVSNTLSGALAVMSSMAAANPDGSAMLNPDASVAYNLVGTATGVLGVGSLIEDVNLLSVTVERRYVSETINRRIRAI